MTLPKMLQEIKNMARIRGVMKLVPGAGARPKGSTHLAKLASNRASHMIARTMIQWITLQRAAFMAFQPKPDLPPALDRCHRITSNSPAQFD